MKKCEEYANLRIFYYIYTYQGVFFHRSFPTYMFLPGPPPPPLTPRQRHPTASIAVAKAEDTRDNFMFCPDDVMSNPFIQYIVYLLDFLRLPSFHPTGTFTFPLSLLLLSFQTKEGVRIAVRWSRA